MEKIKDILAQIIYFLSGVVGVICLLVVSLLLFFYFLFFIWIIDLFFYLLGGRFIIFQSLIKALNYFCDNKI
jgi:hypothetical protein